MVSSSKSSTVSKDEMLPRIDIDGKFTKNLPELVKGKSVTTLKSSTVSKDYTVTSPNTFKVSLTDNSNSMGSDTETTITATLIAQNTGDVTVNIWVDNTAIPYMALNPTYAQNLLNSFYSLTNLNNIYKNITNIYGAEWGSGTDSCKK